MAGVGPSEPPTGTHSCLRWGFGVRNRFPASDAIHPSSRLRLDDLLTEADQFWGGVTSASHDAAGPGGAAAGEAGAAAAAGAAPAAWRAHLGLDGSEPAVVRDAAALAWLRRGALRLVVVLVPDTRALQGGGGLGGRPALSDEHARSATRVLQEARRLGNVLAGTVSDTIELLQRVVEDE